MVLTVTLPTGMEIQDWASCIITDFDAFGTFSPLDDPLEWQDWAGQFLNATSLVEDFPDPYGFDINDWRLWAERFVQTTL
jgi:hypothetical protein